MSPGTVAPETLCLRQAALASMQRRLPRHCSEPANAVRTEMRMLTTATAEALKTFRDALS